MSDFRKLAHLEEQLGPERFAALIRSANTGKVKAFCDQLTAAHPTTMTVGGRTYDILEFFEVGEQFVKGDMVVSRAKAMGAHQGRDDGEHLLAHQDEIPMALRSKVAFVFTDWQYPDSPGSVCFVYWDGDHWIQNRFELDGDWSGPLGVLRRHSTRA